MRVLVLGAGGNAANNVIRCLRESGHWALGADTDPTMLPLSDAHKTVVVPPPAERDLGACQKFLDGHGIGMIWAQPTPEVEWLAANRGSLDVACAVPPLKTVQIANDKSATARLLGDIAPHRTGFERGGWMRLTRGSGAAGAIHARNAAAAAIWRQLYELDHGPQKWMIQEYLPGREFSWTGLYSYGRLAVSVAKQRLRPLHEAPCSTAKVQRTIGDPRVNQTAELAVNRISLDRPPHGAFMVDLREDSHGVPKVTEVNAGRFGTTIDFYRAAGVCLPSVAIEIACGAYPGPWERRDPCEAGLTWLRNTDTIGRLV